MNGRIRTLAVMAALLTAMSIQAEPEREIRAILLHLGHNFWCDWHAPGEKPNPEAKRPPDTKLRCRDEHWRAATDHAAAKGCNMVVIDLGEGLVYPSHPELAIEGSWSSEKMRTEVARLRGLGLEPIPKLNFSMTHNGWLGPWRRQVSTPAYDKVCKDILKDVYEIFDHPRFVHIGYDEENAGQQESWKFNCICVRTGDRWWIDFLKIVEAVEELGARAWAWSDACWKNPEEFVRRCPKTVVQSNWFYDEWSGGFDPETNTTVDQPRLKAFWLLDAAGFDQIPCGSTWAAPKRLKERGTGDDIIAGIVRVGRRAITSERCKGFLMASWIPLESPETLMKVNHATDLLVEAAKGKDE